MASSKAPRSAKSKWRPDSLSRLDEIRAKPKLPGVPHLAAIRALQKAGFRIVRQGRHVVMSDGQRILTIPRHNPVNAITMAGIVRDAGLTLERLRELLQFQASACTRSACPLLHSATAMSAIASV